MNENISIGTAYSHLPYSEKLLLTGVTAWGARLLYRIASRTLSKDHDDPRYDEVKKEEGFWNKALFSIFLPEAVFQALISLPFTLPFRALDASAVASPLHVHPEYTHGIAVGLFSAGFALEILSDIQLAAHQKNNPDDLNREGVWSIVRHPK
jgi:steroid 5-alpha reductase family enzyme